MRYWVLEPLGRGGMGEVFLAEDTELGRKVALKFLPESLEGNPDALARLRREAKAAAALDHSFICKVYEVAERDDGRSFIAMEYVEGETLSQSFSRGSFELEDAVRVGIEIAEALIKAHSRGVVNPDLKPANVMIARDGHVKVMDFGLAKHVGRGSEEGLLSEAETREGITRAGIAGTPGYPQMVATHPDEQFGCSGQLARM